jgi:glycolate oxidase
VKADLERIFGRVLDDVDEHGADSTENPPRRPAFVVEATRAEQVGELLKLAGEHGVPVTPKVTGLNVGGLAIPSDGGIVLDLRKMTGCEIDPDNMVAWIEPGVSWQQLKDEAEKHDLTLGFPLAPPECSVLACALMDGLSTKALAHGSFADWVHGVVAYLADGTRVVTGSAAVTGRPLSRGPLPDLTGLFVSWFGATGVVVRLGFILWPKRRLRRRDAIACRTLEEGVALMRAGATTGLFDDLGGLGWPAGKWALGVDDLGPRDPDEPELYVIADYAADTKAEMRVKRERLASLAPRTPIPVEDLITLSPELAPFAELPTRIGFLLDHEGGGLSWVGTYGPIERVVEGARACMEVLERFGHPPLVVTRPMKSGHYAILRFIERFDRSSPEETENVRRLNVELARTLLDRDFVPYKCPAVLYDEVLPRLDPGFRETMLRVKRALDPKGILSPERWRLD